MFAATRQAARRAGYTSGLVSTAVAGTAGKTTGAAASAAAASLKLTTTSGAMLLMTTCGGTAALVYTTTGGGSDDDCKNKMWKGGLSSMFADAFAHDATTTSCDAPPSSSSSSEPSSATDDSSNDVFSRIVAVYEGFFGSDGDKEEEDNNKKKTGKGVTASEETCTGGPGKRVVVDLDPEIVDELPIMDLDKVRQCNGMNKNGGGDQLLVTYDGT